MTTGETGPYREFPTTIWTDILAAGDPTNKASREKLGGLCRTYWRPVFSYIRIAWGKSVEDAKDLAQAYFSHLLEKEVWSELRPERGSFRGFLKTSLKYFLIKAKRHDNALKRSGPSFSIEADPEEFGRLEPASPDETPERAFDRHWFKGLMDDAISQLRETLRREGKEKYFDAFQQYCLPARSGEVGEPTYKDVADKVGVSESDIRNILHRCRERIRAYLRLRIRDYVATDEEVEQELREAAGV